MDTTNKENKEKEIIKDGVNSSIDLSTQPVRQPLKLNFAAFEDPSESDENVCISCQ